MAAVWDFIKKHPYISTAVVFTSVGAFIFFDQQRRQAEMEERIRRNREESQRRDRARQEATAAGKPPLNSSSSSSNSSTSSSSNSVPKATIPRTPSLTKTEFEEIQHKRAPSFAGGSFLHGAFEEFDLESYSKRWVVLIFMPLESTDPENPVNANISTLCGLQEYLRAFHDRQCDIIVVCPESKTVLKTIAESPKADHGLGGVDFPLVADLNGTAAKQYSIIPNSGPVIYVLSPNLEIKARESHSGLRAISPGHILSTLEKCQTTQDDE